MEYRKLGNSELSISVITLGTWSFGGDKEWWGEQSEKDSFEAMEYAVKNKINMFDTAPIYGRGKSETIIGNFLKKNNVRKNIFIATKTGLSWNNKKIYMDLSHKRILAEVEESRNRLQSDYFDLYQVHWPDKNTPIEETATTLKELYDKKIIRAIGVSNYSIEQMTEFMKYAPLHSLQPPYSMFNRDIEKDVTKFCLDHNIGIISYSPLQQGILTGKYFFNNELPNGKIRAKNIELQENRYDINKNTLEKLKKIADKYNMSLTHLAIVWNYSQEGITSAIVGARNKEQVIENAKSTEFTLSENDLSLINNILMERETLLKSLL